jgi:hypothetical protein
LGAASAATAFFFCTAMGAGIGMGAGSGKTNFVTGGFGVGSKRNGTGPTTAK